MPRPKHPRRELEALLKEAERKGWAVERGKRYYKMKCPCPKQCKKTIHITPNRNYERDARAQLSRATCWDEGE